MDSGIHILLLRSSTSKVSHQINVSLLGQTFINKRYNSHFINRFYSIELSLMSNSKIVSESLENS
jgi:hypothetical protein